MIFPMTVSFIMRLNTIHSFAQSRRIVVVANTMDPVRIFFNAFQLLFFCFENLCARSLQLD